MFPSLRQKARPRYRKSFLCQDTQLCIVMEYCGGGDLRKVIKDKQKAGGLLEESVVLPWCPPGAPAADRRATFCAAFCWTQ